MRRSPRRARGWSAIARGGRRRCGASGLLPAALTTVRSRSCCARLPRRRALVGLVATEVFPADGLPGRAVRAAFPCPLDRRRERVAAADRLPGAPAARPELDTEDSLRLNGR